VATPFEGHSHVAAISTEIIIILLLIAFNGVLAMSEMAVVSARRVRLEQRARQGNAARGWHLNWPRRRIASSRPSRSE
jgi:putative hemolysin